MRIPQHNPWLPAVVSLLTMVGGLTAIGQSQAWADPLPMVVVNDEEPSCAQALTAIIVEELKIRTAAKVNRSTVASENGASWRLTIDGSVERDRCEVRLESEEEQNSFVTSLHADHVELASIATRLAWIIDIPPDNDDTPAATSAAPSNAMALPGAIDLGSRRGHNTTAGGVDDSRLASWSVDIIGGPMWIPSTNAVLTLMRVGARWQPRSNIGLNIVGRMPTGAAQGTTGAYDIGYRPWALEMTATYLESLSDRWSISGGGGVRWTHFDIRAEEGTIDSQQGGLNRQISSENRHEPEANQQEAAENRQEEQQGSANNHQEAKANHQEGAPAQRGPAADRQGWRTNGVDDVAPHVPVRVTGSRDSTLHNALSPWAIAVSTAVGYTVAPALSIRLQMNAAMSLTERQIRDDQQVVMDLGLFEVDLMLGLDMRF